MNRFSLSRLSLSFAAMLLLACGGKDSRTGDTMEVKNDTPALNDSTQAKYQRLIGNIPIPLEILEKLAGSGVRYRDSLINPIGSAAHYIKSQAQAINLGIYGSDLTYVISMEQFGQVSSHIKTVKRLADEIVIPTAFDEGMMTRYNANRNNRDSLSNMIYQSYQRIDNTLKNNERIGLAALVVTGGWVESLYLTTQHLTRDGGEKNKTLLDILAEQQRHLGNLISLLEDFKSDEYITELKTDLEALQKIYPAKAKKLDDETVKAIAAKIAEVRKKAVELE